MVQEPHVSGRVAVDGYKMQGIFRFLLAIAVLWSHSLTRFFPEATDFMGFIQIGNAAVSVFFVLSGFLMAQAINRFYWERPFNFIANRYVRIAPPLLIAAFLSVAAHLWALRMGTLAASLEEIPVAGLTTANVIRDHLSPIFPFNGLAGKLLGLTPENYYQFVRYSWAIFTEILFYWLLFTFVILARVSKSVTFASVFFLFLASALFLIGIAANGPWKLDGVLGRLQTLPFVFHMQWAPHFMIGVLAYYCSRATWADKSLNLLLAAFALMAVYQIHLYGSHGGLTSVGLLIVYSITLGLAMAIMMSNRQAYQLGPIAIGRTQDRWVGDLSYPIYINQFALALVILSLLSLLGIDLQQQSLWVRLLLWVGFNAAILLAARLLIGITDVATVAVRNRLRGTAI